MPVPIYLSSTNHVAVSTYNFILQYDTSCFLCDEYTDEYTYFNNAIVNAKGVQQGTASLGANTAGTQIAYMGPSTGDAIIKYCAFGDDEQIELGQFVLKCTTETVLALDTFCIKPVRVGYLDNADDNSSAVSTDEIGSYFAFEIPATVGDDWTYGYVHALYAQIGDGSQQQLTNYQVTDDGNYRFIVIIKNTQDTKAKKDITIYAYVASTADAEETENISLGTYSMTDFVIEKSVG